MSSEFNVPPDPFSKIHWYLVQILLILLACIGAAKVLIAELTPFFGS